ncbi:MAG: hypothetical protein VB108_08345 [Anaerolineaceae bacterium]|nr:hypothetical protein [Anaerolineaceae bacterium]
MDSKPELTFFTELEPKSLTKLFEDRFVLDDLKALNASVSMGLIDLSDERAGVVKRLNKIGVPVIAWLLLPKEQGYWYCLDNYPFAIARYEAFKAWTAAHKLEWAGVGLDIEPDYEEAILFEARNPKVLPKVWKRLQDKKHYEESHLAYMGLVNKIHEDAYPIEAYHSTFVVDDRKASSTVLKRALGLIDVQVDRVVLMLYSSFNRPYGQAMLQSYASSTDSFGLGVTGGGVVQDGIDTVAPLSWAEFATDLRIAAGYQKPVHIFSLEGCVQQGFLSRLVTFEWNEPVEEPLLNRALVETGRGALQSLSWILERPFVFMVGLAGVIGSAIFLKEKKKKNKKAKAA